MIRSSPKRLKGNKNKIRTKYPDLCEKIMILEEDSEDGEILLQELLELLQKEGEYE